MINLCILFGGASSEHEVSRMSAASVLANLTPGRYRELVLGITKDGRWLHYTGPRELVESGAWEDPRYTVPAVISPDRTRKGILLLDGAGEVLPVDVVFPVLHGKNGEDGTMQGLLELSGIPYVGSGVAASANCMDKEITHILLQAQGIKKTRLTCVRPPELEDLASLERKLAGELSYPMFVKPANAGSSVGITKVKRLEDLRAALDLALEHDSKAVVEQFLSGQEVECSVLGNGAPVASGVVGELVPENEFYDYAGKYLDGTTAQYIPARLEDGTVQTIRDTAVRAYQLMGCRGLARVDFFVQEGGEVVLNEINTIPGFTKISMYPKLFEAAGLPYGSLIDRLVDLALE